MVTSARERARSAKFRLVNVGNRALAPMIPVDTWFLYVTEMSCSKNAATVGAMVEFTMPWWVRHGPRSRYRERVRDTHAGGQTNKQTNKQTDTHTCESIVPLV